MLKGICVKGMRMSTVLGGFSVENKIWRSLQILYYPLGSFTIFESKNYLKRSTSYS